MVSTNHQIPRGTSTCLQADKTALQMIAGISPGGWTDVLDPTRLCPVEPQLFHPDSWSSQSDRPVSQLAEKTDSEPDPTAIRLVKKSRLSHSIIYHRYRISNELRCRMYAPPPGTDRRNRNNLHTVWQSSALRLVDSTNDDTCSLTLRKALQARGNST